MEYSADLAKFLNEKLQEAGVDTQPIYGEIIVALLVVLAALIIGWIVYHIFERFLTKWAEKTVTKLDDEIIKNIKAPIYAFVIIVGTYYGLESLEFIKEHTFIVSAIFTLLEIFLVTLIVIRIINVVIAWYGEKQSKKRKVSSHILFIFKKLLQLVVILFAFLAILAAFNVDLTGVVVGLGVAGIAIGFALQNILGDLFSAFSIYFDKPFEIGDFVILGEHAGVIKKIGVMSTRITLLQGEELVVSNRELVTTRIRNYKKMQKRRINFGFGVTYDTPVVKLEKIPDMVGKIIDEVDLATPDRIHFKEFGNSSLKYDIVYYINSSDYNKYMDIQQEINLKIKKAFEKEGIEMAFPTQTIHLKK
jgi:small-conductance mechanosensitive channel